MNQSTIEIIIGIMLLIGVIFMRLDFIAFLKRSRSVKGKIVGYNIKNSDGSEIYAPIVEFITLDDENIRLEYKTYSSIIPGEVGDEVTVYYDTKNPFFALINTRFNRHGIEVFFTIAGIMMIYMGLR